MGEIVSAELSIVEWTSPSTLCDIGAEPEPIVPEPHEPEPHAPEVRIFSCQPNNLVQWVAAEPYLLRALEHTDEWAIEHVRDGYCNATLGIILCLADDKPFGALCCEVITYPLKKVLQVHLFGADDHSEAWWMSGIWPQLQDLARAAGCQSVMGTGRDGWVRKLQAKRRYLWEVPL